VLALTTRPLTTAERAELEARRAALIVKYSEDDESYARARAGATWAILWFVALFGLIALFNLHTGHIDTALVAVAGAVFMGLIMVRRLDAEPLSLLDRPPLMRIEQALDANLVHVIDIHADATVALHDGGPEFAGHLLRTAADQVIYVSRELCVGVDPEQLPNTRLRFVFSDNLEFLRVEALGERCEPLATVVDHSLATDPLWNGTHGLLVWTPSEDHFAVLDFGCSEPYSLDLDLDFRRLTTALVSRIYR
jgi:hypothetical protein